MRTLVGIVIVFAARGALANCALGDFYSATVEGNKVTVCPMNNVHRGCPDASGMLRQDETTSAVVKLADSCATVGEKSCYADECVARGSYRYGFATPYKCNSMACGTDYFVEAAVTTDLAAGCTRTGAAPSDVASAPWKSDSSICGYGGGDCAMARGRVAGIFVVQAIGLALGLLLLARRRRAR